MKSKSYYDKQYKVQLSLNAGHRLFYRYAKSLMHVNSIFEFGCNSGKNLNNLKLELKRKGLVLEGIDINQKAINVAHDLFNLDGAKIGDEKTLEQLTSKYDLVFTISVLCHIENIELIINNLEQISNRYVMLIETKNVVGDYYFKHNYEKYGYKKVFYFYSNENSCIYDACLKNTRSILSQKKERLKDGINDQICRHENLLNFYHYLKK